MNIIKKTSIAIILMGTFVAVNAFGEESYSRGQGRGRQGPPQAAYTACEDKQAGDTAEFETRRGFTVTGTCEQEGDRLVLRPDCRRQKSNNDWSDNNDN